MTHPKFSPFLLFLTLFFLLLPPPTSGNAESIHHEEVYKKETDTGALVPVFLTDGPSKQLYAKPKYCLREPPPQIKKDASEGHKFVSTWMDFMNEFYWDNGQEYSKWTHTAEGLKAADKEPWYMVPSVIIPVFLYMLSMLVTGILAPFIACFLFRVFHLVWRVISHNRMRNLLRKLWTNNEIRKRKQVLMIYKWARKIPKIRAQLPWTLRRHPDEEMPNDLKDLIAPSSSAESSIGEEDVAYYFDGTEQVVVIEPVEGTKGEKPGLSDQKKQGKSKGKKSGGNLFKKKKSTRVIPPWRTGYQKILSESHKTMAEVKESMAVIGGTGEGQGKDKGAGDGDEKRGSGEDFHV